MTSGLAARRTRLGNTVKALRRRRRLNVETAASRAGMSSTTWQRVEDGLGVRSLTYRGVESVLGLRDRVLDELLDGTADWAELDNVPGGEKTITVEGLSEEEHQAAQAFFEAIARSRQRNGGSKSA